MQFCPLGPFDVVAAMRTADLQPMGVGRLSGLHLSDLVRDMRAAAGEALKGPEGEQEGVRIQAGFLWETVVELTLTGMGLFEAWELAMKRWGVTVVPYATQIQLERDGIHMTPDAVDFHDGAVLSFKATWKSMSKSDTQQAFEENFWHWLVAEKAYCLAAGVDTVRFHIMWMGGDYRFKGGRGPGHWVYECVFTPEELVDNWQTLLKYKAAREAGK